MRVCDAVSLRFVFGVEGVLSLAVRLSWICDAFGVYSVAPCYEQADSIALECYIHGDTLGLPIEGMSFRCVWVQAALLPPCM